MDMNTFRDLFQRRDQMLHEHAMWSELKDHLNKFLDGDAAPTKLGIVSKGAGGVVPQDVLMGAQLQIDTILEDLQTQISTIEQTEVAKNESTTEEKPKSEPAPDGAPASKKRKAAEPTAGAK